jgi:hypothetical protein
VVLPRLFAVFGVVTFAVGQRFAASRAHEPKVPPVESQTVSQLPHVQQANAVLQSCGTALQPQLPAVGEAPPRGAPTRPLVFAAGLQAVTESQVLPVLPNGALIGDERYRVVKAVHQSKQLNRYVVEGLERVLFCPSCNTDNPEALAFARNAQLP